MTDSCALLSEFFVSLSLQRTRAPRSPDSDGGGALELFRTHGDLHETPVRLRRPLRGAAVEIHEQRRSVRTEADSRELDAVAQVPSEIEHLAGRRDPRAGTAPRPRPRRTPGRRAGYCRRCRGRRTRRDSVTPPIRSASRSQGGRPTPGRTPCCRRWSDTKKIRPFACQHPSSRRKRAPPAASPSTNTADSVAPRRRRSRARDRDS